MGRSEEILIKSLSFGGDGVGRIDGTVCFVPYSVPGDRLRVRIVSERPTFLRGEIEAILQPSTERRAARCRHFGRCGGCQWQQVSYERQLREKEQILRDALQRIAGLEAPLSPIVASAAEYGYRTRARLRVDASGRRGYFARSSNDLVTIEECPILVPELEQRVLAPGRARDSGSGARRGVTRLTELEALTEGSTTTGVTERPLPEAEGDSAYAFHQANRFVNAKLTAEVAASVHRFFPDASTLEVIDLFCGDGNLSLPLSPHVGRVRGYDSSEESIREASEAARRRAYDHVTFSRLDAGRALSSLLAEGKGPDATTARCMIADPPRAGLRRLVDRLVALAPELFLYVSCSPPTLARDAKALVQGGFTLEQLTPFDMFPQTFHLETLAVFTHPRG